MQIKLKISILTDDGNYLIGPGPLRLLKSIKEHKSINKAAKSMNLSYVKALKILKRLKKGHDLPMVIVKRGGNERGGTQLTPYSEVCMEQYVQLEEKIKKYAENELANFKKALQKKALEENK